MSEPSGADDEQFDYFAWRKKAPTFPCAPAKGFPKLAESPDKVLFRELTSNLETEIAAQLEQLVAEAIGTGAHLVVARVDAWTEEVRFARSLIALRDQHGWTLRRQPRRFLSPAPFFEVSLRRIVSRHPIDGIAVESIPMVLGPLEHFPRSRFCPVPIFEMSVCVAKTEKRGGKHRINFLGIPTPKLSDAQRQDLMDTTKIDTATVNGGEDPRAKPSVTATFSVSLEQLFN